VTVKALLKAAARGAAHVAVLPLWPSFALRTAVLGRDRAVEASAQWLALIPGLTGQYVRRAFFSRAIAACHRSVVVECGTTLSRAGARFGENVYIGPGCSLGLVDIEPDVLIAGGVRIPSGGKTHRIDDRVVPIREQPRDEQLVRIGAGCWIGEASVIMADVGHDTVVGAGSVVTRPLPPRCIAAGVPARILRMRDSTVALAR
jgi:virginiamycin A acetyltransferase